MEAWIYLLQLSTVALLLYLYFKRKYSYWSSRGVQGPEPAFLFGNLLQIFRIGLVQLETEWLAKYGKVYGLYQSLRPVLTVADPELLKQVMIKDFSVFVNRDKNLFEHEIWSSSLFNALDEQWKRIRAITSPSFTTGKLRGMHSMMNLSVDKLVHHFERVIQTDGGKINAKKVISGFTIDVIATTSFATETNANDPRNRNNPFLDYGTKLFNINPLRFLSVLILPIKFNHWIKNSIAMDDNVFNWFVDLSKAIIRQRKQELKTVKRNDLVQLLMDAFVYENELTDTNYGKLTASADTESNESTKQNDSNSAGKKSLTENEIIAQCIMFFIAGFETTATTISNCLYNLAIHPEAQDRLKAELDLALDGMKVDSEQYNDKVNSGIEYLDAVIKETLRKCPPLGRVQRQVGVDGYKLGGIPLEKGTIVEVGIYAVHHNPEYYPDPEHFNPDRFMSANKHLLVPNTFLAFGGGPRNCIGIRFAYQEIKLCLAKIIRLFKFEPTTETKVPLDYDKVGVVIKCDNIPLKVSKR